MEFVDSLWNPESLVQDYGFFGLFFVCFLAATLLPFSSEIAVAVAAGMGWEPISVLFWSSLGNGLACVFNYFLGYFFRSYVTRQLETSRIWRKVLNWTHSKGEWLLLFSFMPVVGDPITVISGFAKHRFFIFFPIVIGLRILRYGFILFLVSYQ